MEKSDRPLLPTTERKLDNLKNSYPEFKNKAPLLDNPTAEFLFVPRVGLAPTRAFGS